MACLCIDIRPRELAHLCLHACHPSVLQVRARFEASQHEVDEDTQPLDPTELVRKEWTEQMEPPASLVLPVLPYQKEGLVWMHHQEHSPYHGGILADEVRCCLVMRCNRSWY